MCDLCCPCSSLESGSTAKGGSLSAQFPQRSDGKELKILVQPETQHRARYLTEGSRGSVKDRTQQGFPTVKVPHWLTLCSLTNDQYNMNATVLQ